MNVIKAIHSIVIVIIMLKLLTVIRAMMKQKNTTDTMST